MGHVTFENSTERPVTFAKKKANSDPTYCFSLQRNETYSYNLVAAGTHGGPATYEKLQLVDGADANGALTTVTITTDELDGLDKVIITWRDGEFHLEKQKRSTIFGRLKQKATNYIFGPRVEPSEGSGSRV